MPTKIRGLGEIALRVADLAAMRRFYEDVLGLEVLGVFEKIVFFRIAAGHGGHTQVLALFDREGVVRPQTTTLDHLAFTIDLEDFETERARPQTLGLKVELATHAWVHWRSLYVRDPEGNNVELVCYDAVV